LSFGFHFFVAGFQKGNCRLEIAAVLVGPRSVGRFLFAPAERDLQIGIAKQTGAVTPASIWSTRLALLPLIVTPAAEPVIVSVPVVSLSSSWPPVRVIVCEVAKTVGSNWMVLSPPGLFACVMQ
jgi:hypothetical protein